MVYEYLPHTADAKIQVIADSLTLAFDDLTSALCHLIVDKEVELTDTHSVSLSSKSLEMLVFSFVDAWIILLEVDGFLATQADVSATLVNDEWLLEGELLGDNISSYDTHGNIKAPTLHDLFAENSSSVRFRITVDL